MDTTIVCPNCNTSFPASQVFVKHLETERLKVQAERDKLRADAQKWRTDKEEELKKDFAKFKAENEQELRRKIASELETTIKNAKNEAEELAERNKKQQQELLDMGRNMRQMKAEREEMELANEKKLAALAEQIKGAERKKAEEEAHFKILELEKRLSDVSRVNEDLKRKLEQGSQQMQGEVLELEFEQTLMKEFPYDEIQPVPKGVRGADILHIVKNNKGLTCGVILWELKRTKAWSDSWIEKLNEDKRRVNADIPVIISQVVPETVKFIGEIDGVIIGEYMAMLAIARLVRSKLIDMTLLRTSSQNMDGKKDILYNYVTSKEFKHRVEAIAEVFNSQQDLLEKEKRWFALKWAKQEKMIRTMADNTYAMIGELEGIMGPEFEAPAEVEMLPDSVDESSEEVAIEEKLFD